MADVYIATDFITYIEHVYADGEAIASFYVADGDTYMAEPLADSGRVGKHDRIIVAASGEALINAVRARLLTSAYCVYCHFPLAFGDGVVDAETGKLACDDITVCDARVEVAALGTLA